MFGIGMAASGAYALIAAVTRQVPTIAGSVAALAIGVILIVAGYSRDH